VSLHDNHYRIMLYSIIVVLLLSNRYSDAKQLIGTHIVTR
jgi:hypothetical protein